MIDETGKVTFTPEEQSVVDRVVQDRLARENSKYEGHEDLKGIAEELQAWGYAGTPKEIREVVKSQREAAQQQTQLEELEKQAKTEGTTPALLARIEKLEKQLSVSEGERNASKKAEEAKAKANEDWNNQVKEMTETHPDVDLDALAEDTKFKKFAKGKALPLLELYEDFVDFVGEAQAEVIAKVKSKETRSTGSGKGGSTPSGQAHNLTKDQMELVDDWNKRYPKQKMSYKQYADRL